ncbi:hypothetical protein [Bradyrhizobium japonicum]|uniref:hypothetical protein n=1 Tax=Bradyrhizobium japonicum TaxID=375 RepID=UPI0034E4A7D5
MSAHPKNRDAPDDCDRQAQRKMLDLEKPREVARDAQQQRDPANIGEDDARTAAADGAGGEIGEPAASEHHQRDDQAEYTEPVTIDVAEIMQLAQRPVVETDAEDVRIRKAAPQRRRPDGDGGKQQHDGQRQPDIGDQSPHDDRNSGQKIAGPGRDQIVGIVAQVSDRRRIADLGGRDSSADGSFAEYKAPCRRHGGAERGADIAAARHRGEIVDPADQIVVVQCLEHAEANGRRANATAGQRKPDDVEQLAGLQAVGVEAPFRLASGVDRLDLIADDLMVLLAPGRFLIDDGSISRHRSRRGGPLMEHGCLPREKPINPQSIVENHFRVSVELVLRAARTFNRT